MARHAVTRVAVALVAIVCALSTSRAEAQLASLHVRRFTMAIDPTTTRVGDTVRLTIDARVDERVVELDNVILPDLSGFDTLGDERHCTATDRGSDCTETIALSPTVAGDRTIAATVMDAIDARNGKPSRFETNSVLLHVAPAPLEFPSWIGSLAWSIVLAVLPIVLVVVAAWALIWGFGRRSAVPVRVEPTIERVPPPPLVDPDVRLRELIAALAAEPTRARARAVRAALRERVGARDDETLEDIATHRTMADRSHVLAALRAIERASFCEDDRVARAVEEALPCLNF